MEQRRTLTLAQRIKLKPANKRRRVSQQDQQDKPKTGKKGKRGQAEGMRSKASTKEKTPFTRKKPGRQKQTANARKLQAKRRRSGS